MRVRGRKAEKKHAVILTSNVRQPKVRQKKKRRGGGEVNANAVIINAI